MSTLQDRRPVLVTLYTGLALTALATAAPFADRATGQVLADHVRDGYPAYTAERIDTAVATWLVVLAAVGVLGMAAWVTTIWATRGAKRWSRWAITAGFVLGTSAALSTALVQDTSGEVGLAPVLGGIGLLPCVAGLAAVVLAWRRA